MAAFYAWLRRHPRLVDGVPALLLSVSGIGQAAVTRNYLMILGVLALSVSLVFRRGHPVGAFVTVLTVGAVQVLTGTRPVVTDLAILIMLYTLAAYTTRRVSVAGLLACLLGDATAVARWWSPRHMSGPTWLFIGSVVFAAPTLVAWVLGDSMNYRRAYYAALEERAVRAERERDAHVQIAAAAERARIARELHDVVAHHVSVMVVQADGASYALDRNPERAKEAMTAISATGRQALAEMRRLLGILRRDDATPQDRAPQPGIEQIGELVEQSRTAGLPVTFAVEGVPQPMPGGAALAVYRVVQESLTNTRKHAGPAASATVMLHYLEDGLELTVSDDGRGMAVSDGAGHGLAGMSQRLAIYGGSVEAGPRPGGGFQVTARLPLNHTQAGAA
ncbi:MAG TPA: histidine kinase [Streptosporangiaceae bacterium]|nr:histidine kinase [Streptosporangiaceae bacterium]